MKYFLAISLLLVLLPVHVRAEEATVRENYSQAEIAEVKTYSPSKLQDDLERLPVGTLVRLKFRSINSWSNTRPTNITSFGVCDGYGADREREMINIRVQGAGIDYFDNLRKHEQKRVQAGEVKHELKYVYCTILHGKAVQCLGNNIVTQSDANISAMKAGTVSINWK